MGSDGDIKQQAFDFARHQRPHVNDWGCLSAGEINLMNGYVAGYRAGIGEALRMARSPDAFEPAPKLHYEGGRFRELIHNLEVLLLDEVKDGE